ncbi:MAG: ribonuclease HII [Nitrososphaerales archaeon]
MIVAGVDEAGRGSVIGPLVVAGIKIKRSKVRHLKESGVADSKKLTPKERLRLYGEIVKIVDDYYIHVLKPATIDRFVAVNALNFLEASAMALVINRLAPRIAYVDSCDVNPERFKKTILSKLTCSTRVDSKHHADSENIVVSAASILAKVKRDHEIDKLRKKIGDLGSGYPSDRKTMAYINEWIYRHKKAPVFARSSWKPVRKMLSRYAQTKLVDFNYNRQMQ